ncbi:MAG TPA: hypothetical protein VGP78_07075 [Solirubrobacteraceae bacterium]|jgi:hypothetical protein|nr:hypothetical protein [Solirubrobacteraceae bacterium]
MQSSAREAAVAPQLSGRLPVSDEQGRLPGTMEDAWMLARRELERSRRYGHPLALVRIVPLQPMRTRLEAGVDVDAPSSRRARADRAAADLVSGLRETLREIDAVWTDRRGVFMLLPESDAASGHALVGRLRSGERPLLTGEDDVRVGAFPADGLTLDAMIAAVTRPVAAPALPVMLAEDEGAPMRRRLRSASGHPTAEGIADQAG